MKMILFLLHLLMIVSPLGAQEQPINSDSLETLMQQQVVAFPQEKIYLQTDKSNYLSGERIWLRAHLVDALTHQPVYISRYVYVEIINPLDDLVKRIKIRPDSTGAYHGYLDLDDDLVQGAYTLRAYTHYMRNMDEDYFFRKGIEVLDPFSLQLEPLVTFDVEQEKVNVSIQFLDRQQNDTVAPEVVTCKIGHGTSRTLKPSDSFHYNHKGTLSDRERNRTLLLGLIYNGRKYNRYYTIPTDQADYDLTFFPEGGYLIPGVTSQVAFKALNSDGLGTSVTATLYDSKDHEILTFKTLHLGMGFFHFIPAADETYHVICRNEQGQEKRFTLPLPAPEASVVTARILREQLMVILRKGEDAMQDSLSLLIHHKGVQLFHQAWDPAVEMYTFPVDELPSGILNLLLLNDRQEVVSERLIFNLQEESFALMQADLSQSLYRRRELVSMRLKLTDASLNPSSGNIAVSVTDKATVQLDSTMNIIATMLLSSELKGYIESPASYFKDKRVNKYALDALMLTQGWRRYDIPGVIRGEIALPDAFEPERAQKITGEADAIFGSLKEGQISLMARLDTLVSSETTVADDRGRFSFNVEYPEGTTILVQSRGKKGGRFNSINLDQQSFPSLQGAGLPVRGEDYRLTTHHDPYLRMAHEDYTQKNGIRTIMLDEFTVTAPAMARYKESSFYSPINAVGLKTADDIEKMAVSSLRSLLYRQSGIVIRGDLVTTTRSELPVLFVIDDMKFENFSGRLDDIEVNSIESIFVLKDNTSMPGYYPNTSGAVVITTRIGAYEGPTRRPPSIDEIIPLGYQQAAHFYSPAYETGEQIDSPMPDLRTTLFWNPSLQFSEEGEAVVDFYAADTPTIYEVVCEGVDRNGKLIRFTKEITVEGSSNRE